MLTCVALGFVGFALLVAWANIISLRHELEEATAAWESHYNNWLEAFNRGEEAWMRKLDAEKFVRSFLDE